MNYYSQPKEYRLTMIGEIQWGEANYDFDLTVVWRRDDGVFLFGEDSGCSCPSPFEDASVDDLRRATPLAVFKAHLESRGGESQAADIAELLERMHRAGAR